MLLIGWGRLGHPATGEAIFEAIAGGRMDHYLVRPARPPDEQFHQAISSFLLAWAEARHSVPYTTDVIGETWSGRAYELREVLERCAMPHRFFLASSDEGRAVLGSVGAQDEAAAPGHARREGPRGSQRRGHRASGGDGGRSPGATSTTW